MARYDYDCSHCKEIREYNHPMTEDLNGVVCDCCEYGTLRKVISVPAVSFKGQGWGGSYRAYAPKKNE